MADTLGVWVSGCLRVPFPGLSAASLAVSASEPMHPPMELLPTRAKVMWVRKGTAGAAFWT